MLAKCSKFKFDLESYDLEVTLELKVELVGYNDKRGTPSPPICH